MMFQPKIRQLGLVFFAACQVSPDTCFNGGDAHRALRGDISNDNEFLESSKIKNFNKLESKETAEKNAKGNAASGRPLLREGRTTSTRQAPNNDGLPEILSDSDKIRF